MTDLLAGFWVHDVTVERKTGSGAYGDTFAASDPLLGFVDDGSRLVRDMAGNEVVSSARVFLPAATVDVPPGSKVTLPAKFGGRTSQVIKVARHDSAGLGLPDHIEVSLQ